jgi:hypothetical protein
MRVGPGTQRRTPGRMKEQRVCIGHCRR